MENARSAGPGGNAPLLKPASRKIFHPPRANEDPMTEDEQSEEEEEEYDETRKNLQTIRVKFLRLARRLNQTPENALVAQVLYRLGLAEQRKITGAGSHAFSFGRASAMAERLESPPGQQEPLDFTCTIMVIGKSGAGKSATLNSILDKLVFATNAFNPGTNKVQDHVGTMHGIKVRVIDTPGLSLSNHSHNEKILRSVKSFVKKTPPDVVLYVDRLDARGGEFSADVALLGMVTSVFGQFFWSNVTVVFTHAASAPPESPSGKGTSYDAYVTQRSHVVQQAIREASGDRRLMNPVSLVENHLGCRTNMEGQRVLPNGQVWKHHLLLLCFASTILAEANILLKFRDAGPPVPRRRLPHLPSLLSSFLQPRPQVKLPAEQFGDDDDDDLDDGSDSEGDEYEYDKLPPFKPLTKDELGKLSRSQRKAYYDEIEYREKLFMEKQLKEEKMRRKLMKGMQDETNDSGENDERTPDLLPDQTIPASFDSDYPTHRYRSLDHPNPWNVRPVYDPNGWDHDTGYIGVNVEKLFVFKENIPISVSGQAMKDTNDKTRLQMEIASSVKHGKGKSTSLGFDIQPAGNDMAYTLQAETLFSNRRMNKASAGVTATGTGGVLTGGVKLEDKLSIGRWVQLVGSGAANYGSGDVAHGGGLEVRVMDRDDPLGRFLATLGLIVMEWHGEVMHGGSAMIRIPTGRHDNLVARINVNNRGSGKVGVTVGGSDRVQIALIVLVPVVMKILGYFRRARHG